MVVENKARGDQLIRVKPSIHGLPGTWVESSVREYLKTAWGSVAFVIDISQVKRAVNMDEARAVIAVFKKAGIENIGYEKDSNPSSKQIMPTNILAELKKAGINVSGKERRFIQTAMILANIQEENGGQSIIEDEIDYSWLETQIEKQRIAAFTRQNLALVKQIKEKKPSASWRIVLSQSIPHCHIDEKYIKQIIEDIEDTLEQAVDFQYLALSDGSVFSYDKIAVIVNNIDHMPGLLKQKRQELADSITQASNSDKINSFQAIVRLSTAYTELKSVFVGDDGKQKYFINLADFREQTTIIEENIQAILKTNTSSASMLGFFASKIPHCVPELAELARDFSNPLIAELFAMAKTHTHVIQASSSSASSSASATIR